jgi:hypothetical protein
MGKFIVAAEASGAAADALPSAENGKVSSRGAGKNAGPCRPVGKLAGRIAVLEKKARASRDPVVACFNSAARAAASGELPRM